MDVNEIALRVQKGQRISDTEKVALLRSNPYAWAAFLIENNPGAVNMALIRLGYTHLGFDPDIKAISEQLNKIIKLRDLQSFLFVVRNHNLIPDGLTGDFITQYRNAFSKL